MADWDVFARITKAGRKARAAMESALDGGDLDEGQFARLLDQVVQSAAGIPTANLARKVLAAAELARESADSSNANQFLRRCQDELRMAARAPGTSILDLMLEDRVRRAVFAGQVGERGVLADFFTDCLIRGTFDCRGGLVERLAVPAKDVELARSRARGLVASVAQEAAATLQAKGRVKNLGLTKRFPTTTGLNTRF